LRFRYKNGDLWNDLTLFLSDSKKELSRSKLTQRSKFLNIKCDIIGVRKI